MMQRHHWMYMLMIIMSAKGNDYKKMFNKANKKNLNVNFNKRKNGKEVI